MTSWSMSSLDPVVDRGGDNPLSSGYRLPFSAVAGISGGKPRTFSTDLFGSRASTGRVRHSNCYARVRMRAHGGRSWSSRCVKRSSVRRYTSTSRRRNTKENARSGKKLGVSAVPSEDACGAELGVFVSPPADGAGI